MKVLWLINTLLPEVLESVTGKESPVKGTGGWLQASADAVASSSEIELCIVTVSRIVDRLYYHKGKEIEYYIIPGRNLDYKPDKRHLSYWKTINSFFNADIVHVHGTEFPHAAMLRQALPNVRMIVTVQGLISRIWPYYTAGMSFFDQLFSTTLADILLDILRPSAKCGSILSSKSNYKMRGRYEAMIINSANAVIGRSEWDRAIVMAMCPDASYYVCNETLRKAFYTGKWNFGKCTPHSIFISQASLPFKGLHMVLKAMPYVLRFYPDARIIVSGDNVLMGKKWRGLTFRRGYGQYIFRLLNRLKLSPDIIRFTGSLDAEKMKQQYLDCNVFVSPSAIENTPNSLCEAQMLGVPCIATAVGGTPDLVPDTKCGRLYRFEDVEHLAFLICKVFQDSAAYDGSHEQGIAYERHNSAKNMETLLNVYDEVLNH